MKITTDYTYNIRNQLTTDVMGAVSKTYSYDNNGNQTGTNDGTTTTTLSYDTLNRLTSWTDGSKTETTTYRGAEWHRYSVNDGATTTAFLYDGDNIVADIINGSVDTFYVTPFLDQNLSMTRGGQTYYYSADGLGSVRTLTDSAGVVKNTMDYTAFGETYAPNTSVTVEQRYGFTGCEKNPVSGDYYNRYRTYSPSVGRFTTKDPADSLERTGLFSEQQVDRIIRRRHITLMPCESGYVDGPNLYNAYFVPHARDPFGLDVIWYDLTITGIVKSVSATVTKKVGKCPPDFKITGAAVDALAKGQKLQKDCPEGYVKETEQDIDEDRQLNNEKFSEGPFWWGVWAGKLENPTEEQKKKYNKCDLVEGTVSGTIHVKGKCCKEKKDGEGGK